MQTIHVPFYFNIIPAILPMWRNWLLLKEIGAIPEEMAYFLQMNFLDNQISSSKKTPLLYPGSYERTTSLLCNIIIA